MMFSALDRRVVRRTPMKKKAREQRLQLPLRLRTTLGVALSPAQRQIAVKALARLLLEAKEVGDER
jgi:hypothetical protein